MNQQKPYTIFNFFGQILKPYKWYYLIMFQAPVMGGLYAMVCGYSVKLLIDAFTQHDTIGYAEIFYPALCFLGAEVVFDISCRFHNYLQWKSQPQIRKAIMTTVVEYVVNHSHKFFQNNFSGSVISKVKGITDCFDVAVEAIFFKLTKPLSTSIFCIIFALIINIKIFLMFIVFSIIYAPFCIWCCKIFNKTSRDCAIDYHKIIGFVSDFINNIFTVSSFSSQKIELQKIDKYYDEINIPLQNKFFSFSFWSGVLASLLYFILNLGIFAYIIYLKNTNQITLGDIAFTIQITVIFCDNIFLSAMEVTAFIKIWADLKSSFSILETPHKNIDKINAEQLKLTEGSIEFKNLSFGYENSDNIFNGLNLKIKGGEKVGIVGCSGAGKSTLVSLLLKNFQPQNGDIIIDNQSIYDVDSNSLHSQISLIPQDISLFHRSIGENIGYAKENALQSDIESAAKIASIDDFIQTLPDKYETLVGERGIKLSGGQRQRIAIARAILKNAPILILDEATSALDTETEQQIQKSINEMLKNSHATVIAIAHRLSTIKDLDRIIVMENGNIVEDGTFLELNAKENGKFKKLWDRQVNGMVA